ncbi:MAG TPA: endonuclease/exonuclease/phosphatase family protein [Rhodothermales bacterium]|nr:endonuclease/exonuclease/phosphatase family protein [Rhodothermales bacterium]
MSRLTSLLLLCVVAGAILYACEACTPATPASSSSSTTPPPDSSPSPAAPSASALPGTAGYMPTPIRYRADGVRVAAFNAEFLFDGEGDEGQASFDWKGNPQAAMEHLNRIGEVVRSLDADVVMLAEVENQGVLDQLINGPLAGMGYRSYFVQGTDRFTGQDMGLIARVPVEATGRTDERAPISGNPTETYGVSKNLWARLSIGGVPTTVIGVHFLAIPDNVERKPNREAQAEVIRRLVAAEGATGRVAIVLGDFNDFDDVTLDRAGNRPITNVLATIKRAGEGTADDLTNVLAEVAQRERFSNFYDRNENEQIDEGELGAIDHLLISPALRRRLREVTYAHAHDPRVVTDHFPIVATFAR